MLSDVQAAAYCLPVIYAMDQYVADRASLTPIADPRLLPRGYRIVGYLTGTDCVFRCGRTITVGSMVCYGYLAESVATPGTFIVAIRGTEGILEWIEDGEFAPVPHRVAGQVEAGFYGIYQSLEYRSADNKIWQVAAAGIATAVGPGSVTVLGHSLGAPLASYLAFDLANPLLLGQRVDACLFASPRPGDTAFGAAFTARLASYRVYNYELDVVPRVPRGPDYTDLPLVTWIGIHSAKAHIKFDLACHHHLVSYCSMLDYDLLDWTKMPACDLANAQCIKGPAKI